MEKKPMSKGLVLAITLGVILLIAAAILLIYKPWTFKDIPENQLVERRTFESHTTASAQESMFVTPDIETLTFAAGQTGQQVDLYNPAENSAYLRVTLHFGEEKLFQTDLIDPGQTISAVELTRPLPAGSFSGRLHYEFISLEDGRTVLKTAEQPVKIAAN